MKRRRLQRLVPTQESGRQFLAGLVLGALIIGAAQAMANPADYPNRRINNNTVDLTPLILWWENPSGIRPLKAWKHIQGTLEEEIGPAWKIRCRIEGDATRSILLKDPPKDRLAHFRELQNLVVKLERDRASAEQVAALPAYSGWDWEVYGLPPTRTADFDRIERAKAEVLELDRRIQTAQEELAEMADRHGNFKIDTFVLPMNTTYTGRPVFVFGYFR